MRFLTRILLLCTVLPLPALAADVKAVYADFVPVPPSTTGTFFGGHVKFLPGPNGKPTEPSGGGYRLAESSFGQLAGFTVPYPDFEKVAVVHALKTLYYDKADDTPGYEKAKAAFRYKVGLYNRTGGKITQNFATMQSEWNEDTRKRALAAAEGIAAPLRYSPGNQGLRNALLDVYYDIATAEVILAKELEADALKASMGLNYTPPPGQFVITGEIDRLNQSLTQYQKAAKPYFDLLKDPMGVGVAIGGQDLTNQAFGYQLFREQQPSRSLYATTFDDAGTLKPVLDQNNDGQPDSLFTGYKDLVLLFEIERDSARVAAKLAKLLALRGDGDDRNAANRIVDEAQQRGNTHNQVLVDMSPKDKLATVDGSGLKEARAGLDQALAGLSGIKSFLGGTANPLGLDPDFLVLVQNETGSTFDYFKTRLLGNGTDQPFGWAIGDALNKYQNAERSYRDFRQYQDRIGEELLSHKRQFADRLRAIIGCPYPDPPDPRSCYHTPENNPGSEIYHRINNIQLAGLRIQKNAQEIKNLENQINNEIERRGRERGINNLIAQTHVRYGDRQARLTEEIGEINAKQRLADAAAAATTEIITAVGQGATVVAATVATGGAAAVATVATVATGGATPVSTLLRATTHVANGLLQANYERQKSGKNAQKERLAAQQSAEITGLNDQIGEVNSAALVKNLWLNMSTLSLDSTMASISLAQDVGRLQALLDEKSYLEAQWAEANQQLGQRYFADPTHRIIMNNDILSAGQAFDKAQFWLFIIARALEYKWNQADHLTYEGVKTTCPDQTSSATGRAEGTPECIESDYRALNFSANTVFKLRNGRELAEMAKAIQEFDARNQLGSRHGDTFVRFSLREDFLGYRYRDSNDSDLYYPDPVTGERVDAMTAFRSYIKNIEPETPTEWTTDFNEVVRLKFNTAKPNITGTFFSSARWNEKINWVAVSINAETPHRTLAVYLEQSGTAFIRNQQHGRVDPAHPDRVTGEMTVYPVRYWYRPGTGPLEFLSKDAFGAQIDAEIVRDPQVPVESLRRRQFHEMSPAVSTWTLDIPLIGKSNEQLLDLDKVNDIEIWFYNYYLDRP